MSTMNRRNFFQISAASLLAETLLAEGPAIPLLGQAIPDEMQRALENNPFRTALQRLEAMVTMPLPNWRAHADDLPHPEDPSLDDSSWKEINVLERWKGRPAWFRRVVEIPKSMGGCDIQGKQVMLALRLGFSGNGRARVFFNGSMVEMAHTLQPILLTAGAKPGETFVVAAYAPAGEGDARIDEARLEVDYPLQEPNPLTMLQQILAVQAASKGFPEGLPSRQAQLRAALNQIDFAALDHGYQSAFEQSLAAAQEKMQPLAEWMKQFTIRGVGQSHIDLAWLWPWTETVEVVRDTFGSALELMDEYPQLTYTQSSAQAFLWLEDKYPDLFKEIQKRVKEGRWEMVGGMWCEPDLNMPCGESLVRQLLTGKCYFRKKFDVDVKIGWNPDSFGYSWQLAQIYKRSGVDYFVTTKMGANDTTPFPYKLFWWESPDGSRVLTFFPHGAGINVVQCSEIIADDTPLCSGFRELMLLYGVGDHGGGPTRQMLDAALRWQKSPKAAFPNFKFSTAREFFDEVDKNLSNLNLPVWKSELYFQHHRGTYTTQAESKKRMRESERLMLNTEKFASLAMLDGRQYEQGRFEDCWRRVCFDQFHDQMAGTGIHINFVDEAENLEFVRLAMEPVLRDSLELLAARADTRGPGIPVVVFNSLSWERTDVTEAEVQFPGPAAGIEVVDPGGEAMPSAVIALADATYGVKVRFLARGVPAVGYKVFHVVSTPHPRPQPSTLKVNGLTMDNGYLHLSIDPQTGCVTSLVNKEDGKNILRAGAQGNLLETFVDKPPDRSEDAWNISLDYEKQKTELLNADEVKLLENTPVRAVLRIKKSFQKSSFVQDICLYPEVPRVDVHMHADWHEQHVLLKAAFPLDIAPLTATYEIPYGTIERPAIPHVPGKTPVAFTEAKGVQEKHAKYEPLLAQEAEFEACAQQWGDLSENGRGFSLLSRDKYGYDTVEPGTIRLTLLRSTTSPDPHADQGPHDFTYAMYPHAGGWREANTELRAYELNYHLHPLVVRVHEGSLPSAHSFVRIEPKNVILTAIKKAEDSNSLILRFYEFEGQHSQVRLTLPAAGIRAAQTDLMEKEEHELPLGPGGTEIVSSIGPYEIKCVKVEFQNAAGPTPPRRV